MTICYHSIFLIEEFVWVTLTLAKNIPFWFYLHLEIVRFRLFFSLGLVRVIIVDIFRFMTDRFLQFGKVLFIFDLCLFFNLNLKCYPSEIKRIFQSYHFLPADISQ